MNVVPGDVCDLVGWCDEDAFMVPQHVADHGGPPVSERARFTNEGEVGGVCDTVGMRVPCSFLLKSV